MNKHCTIIFNPDERGALYTEAVLGEYGRDDIFPDKKGVCECGITIHTNSIISPISCPSCGKPVDPDFYITQGEWRYLKRQEIEKTRLTKR